MGVLDTQTDRPIERERERDRSLHMFIYSVYAHASAGACACNFMYVCLPNLSSHSYCTLTWPKYWININSVHCVL